MYVPFSELPPAYAYLEDGKVHWRFCATCGRDFLINPPTKVVGIFQIRYWIRPFRTYQYYAGWHGEGSAIYCSLHCLEKREGIHPLYKTHFWLERRCRLWLDRIFGV